MKYYTVYQKSNDEILAQGTAEECRKQLGFKTLQVFYSMVSRVNRGKTEKYEVLAMDETEEDFV